MDVCRHYLLLYYHLVVARVGLGLFFTLALSSVGASVHRLVVRIITARVIIVFIVFEDVLLEVTYRLRDLRGLRICEIVNGFAEFFGHLSIVEEVEVFEFVFA